MKNLLRYSILSILVLSVIAMSGCNKDEDGNGPDKQSLLTAHVWNFDKLTTTSTDAEVQFTVAFMAALLTESTISFTANGVYTWTILGESDTGTWELSADGKTLTMDKGTEDERTQTLVTLNNDLLETKENLEDEDDGTIPVNWRWVK